MAHHESRIASTVLNIHTNKNGLAGPIQLTRLKLKIRISTPIISNTRMCCRMKAFILVILFLGENFWQSIPADLTGLNRASVDQDAFAAMNLCPQGFYGDLSGLSSGLPEVDFHELREGFIPTLQKAMFLWCDLSCVCSCM